MSSFFKSFTKSLPNPISRNTLKRNLSFSKFIFSNNKEKISNNIKLQIELNDIENEIQNYDWNTYNENMCSKLHSYNLNNLSSYNINNLNELIISLKEIIKEDKYKYFYDKIFILSKYKNSYTESLIKLLLTKNIYKCNNYKTITQILHEVYKKHIRRFNEIMNEEKKDVFNLFNISNNNQNSILKYEKMLYFIRYMHELIISNFNTEYYNINRYYHFQGVLTIYLDCFYKSQISNKKYKETIEFEEIMEELLIYLKIYLINYGNNDKSDFFKKCTKYYLNREIPNRYLKYNQVIEDKLNELKNINYDFKILSPLYKNFEFFYNAPHNNINKLIFKHFDKFQNLLYHNTDITRNHVQNNNLQNYQEYYNSLKKWQNSNKKSTLRIYTFKKYNNSNMHNPLAQTDIYYKCLL